MLLEAFREDIKYRKHEIRKLVQVQHSKMLCLLQSNNVLSFIHYEHYMKNPQKQRNEEDVNVNWDTNVNVNRNTNVKNKKKSDEFRIKVDQNKVLSIDYSEEERLFGVLMTNRKVYFIEDAEMQKSYAVLQSTGTEINIYYLHHHKLWVLESIASTLQIIYSPKIMQQEGQHKNVVFQPHLQPITSIKEITNPMSIVTSSLDGCIRLWQTSTSKLLVQLQPSKQKELGSKQRGIRGIQTSNLGISSYICNWMFTNEIYIWLPSLSLSKPYVGELTGHLGIVEDCKFLPHGELVSIDNKSNVKIWNVYALTCLNNFSIEDSNASIFLLQGKSYLIFYHKLLHFYHVRNYHKLDHQSNQLEAGHQIYSKNDITEQFKSQQQIKSREIRICNYQIQQIYKKQEIGPKLLTPEDLQSFKQKSAKYSELESESKYFSASNKFTSKSIKGPQMIQNKNIVTFQVENDDDKSEDKGMFSKNKVEKSSRNLKKQKANENNEIAEPFEFQCQALHQGLRQTKSKFSLKSIQQKVSSTKTKKNIEHNNLHSTKKMITIKSLSMSKNNLEKEGKLIKKTSVGNMFEIKKMKKHVNAAEQFQIKKQIIESRIKYALSLSRTQAERRFSKLVI